MKTAIIATVLNEEKYLPEFLDSLFNQSLAPNEVVISDGGSTDKTVDVLNRYAAKEPNLKIVLAPGTNISTGRNLAIKAATSEIIAVTDAGARVSKSWLENLVKSLSTEKEIAAGFFVPVASTIFEKSLASITVPVEPEIDPEKFLPSSRSVAFYKKGWKEVGGYPEWLPICEDLVFDLKLKKAKYHFNFVPKATAFWRPRSTIRKFFKQYWLYARGDGQAKLWWRRHLIRYLAYFNGILIISMVASGSVMWLLPFFIGAAGYLYKFYNRFLGHFPNETNQVLVKSFSLIPALVLVGDVAKMTGYPWGNIQRLTGKVKYEPI